MSDTRENCLQGVPARGFRCACAAVSVAQNAMCRGRARMQGVGRSQCGCGIRTRRCPTRSHTMWPGRMGRGQGVRAQRATGAAQTRPPDAIKKERNPVEMAFFILYGNYLHLYSVVGIHHT